MAGSVGGDSSGIHRETIDAAGDTLGVLPDRSLSITRGWSRCDSNRPRLKSSEPPPWIDTFPFEPPIDQHNVYDIEGPYLQNYDKIERRRQRVLIRHIRDPQIGKNIADQHRQRNIERLASHRVPAQKHPDEQDARDQGGQITQEIPLRVPVGGYEPITEGDRHADADQDCHIAELTGQGRVWLIP